MPLLARVVLLLVLFAAPALAQSETGSISGHVLDSETGAPLAGVHVIAVWPAPADGSEPKEDLEITEADGAFRFAVPPGSYRIESVKQGYADATLRNVDVAAGQDVPAELRMLMSDAQPEVPPNVEEFVVLGVRQEMIEASRTESDQLINTLSAEEMAKYSASDIADVILRVPGVNVVEGQFAIIRGLEDRYSSTLYNSALIPSPDPDRQSPQLDLFPSEIVSDLVVAKTFGPEMPSNSSGGSINVLTQSIPDEEIEIAVKAKGGWNDNAIDRFLSFENGSPVGDERDAWNTIEQEYGGTIGGRTSFKGREIRYRALGNWGVDYDTALGFQEGRQPRTNSVNSPSGDLGDGTLSLTDGHFDLTTSDREEQTTGFGLFGFDFDEAGHHGVDLSFFWTKKDEDTVQLKENGYLPGFDYQPLIDLQNANSPVDSSLFSGTIPGNPGNASLAAWITNVRAEAIESPERGPLWFSSFRESKSFSKRRDLMVPQINGHHDFEELLPGLQLKWVANWARTTQDERAYGARVRYEPCGFSEFFRTNCPDGVNPIATPTQFPVSVNDLGPGTWIGGPSIFFNTNDIEEKQWFGRGDAEYEHEWTDWFATTLRTGGWYERAERDIDTSFLQPGVGIEVNPPPICPIGVCSGSGSFQAVYADTFQQLGKTLFAPNTFQHFNGEIGPTILTQSDAKREIKALALGGTTTFWQDLDVLGGARIEGIHIESNNDPFREDTPFSVSTEFDGSPAIYPTKWLLFDRFGDNVRREGGIFIPPPYNDQIIGLKVNSGPCRGRLPTDPVLPGECVDLIDRAEISQFINGEIDETKVLPSIGINYRPVEGLALRAAWSRTVARPSFREMGYYVTVEPASDDLILGNPQLQLSDVESWDGRVEYVYGDYGDLVAVSGFYKQIDDPIEAITLRDPTNNSADLNAALYRTYFNNPNQAKLWGIELEARKNFGFLREAVDIQRWGLGERLRFLDQPVFDNLTIGSNFTWIEAEVDRTEAELQRTVNFFPQGTGQTIHDSRRLYGQPKWIVNADITYDNPEWGTRATLAFYAISDVLDAAGSTIQNRARFIDSYTLDRYIDSFHTLDLIIKQEIWGGVSIKAAAKNLTDSRREIVYDPRETKGKFAERSYHVGRDYTFELVYTFTELPFLPSLPGD